MTLPVSAQHSTEEMRQPCLIQLHATISLVPHRKSSLRLLAGRSTITPRRRRRRRAVCARSLRPCAVRRLWRTHRGTEI